MKKKKKYKISTKVIKLKTITFVELKDNETWFKMEFFLRKKGGTDIQQSDPWWYNIANF